MRESSIESAVSVSNALERSAPRCPVSEVVPAPKAIAPGDELVFPKHKRVVISYAQNNAGQSELQLHYREKVIVFDEPELFAFAETLAKQPRFVASVATTWGTGYAWSRVRGLLEQLLEAGILQRADAQRANSPRPKAPVASPLPPAASAVPRTWLQCEAITLELAGRSVELGYLELIVPVYRVAHPALDAEGRQVGEANVFPPALRVDVATEWRTCQYPGSRFEDEFPMNVTALKSMIKYWKPMMAVLLRMRAEYCQRCGVGEVLTVGDLQRLSTVLMALPAYLMMRTEARVENGALHPLWSSMSRISDGVRLVSHEMLFTPADGAPRPSETPIVASEIYPYAERHHLFLSEVGVCAAPKTLVEEFLSVLVDGKTFEGADSVVLDRALSADLEHLDPVFDYGLYGLKAYAVVFSLWPLLSEIYERLIGLFDREPGERVGQLAAFERRIRDEWPRMNQGFLGDVTDRQARMRAYADMYAVCALGLDDWRAEVGLLDRIAPSTSVKQSDVSLLVGTALRRCSALPHTGTLCEQLTRIFTDDLRREQAIVRAASEIQANINRTLGRPSPKRPLTSADVAFHYRLRVTGALPYLLDAVRDELGLDIVVTGESIAIRERNDS